MAETRETLVLLRILDDEPGRPWFEALDLPAPERFNGPDGIGEKVYVKIELEEVVRGG